MRGVLLAVTVDLAFWLLIIGTVVAFLRWMLRKIPSVVRILWP